MPGPAPKPAHLRQRTNRKAGAGIVSLVPAGNAEIPPIPNPDGREWHNLTLTGWKNAWESPMAAQWLTTDVDALGRLAVLWDEFYNEPKPTLLAEIRLQEQRFGLSPLDRSRLQWEVAKVTEVERKQQQRAVRKTGTDPRSVLSMVK
jgi:hypothetical protein